MTSPSKEALEAARAIEVDCFCCTGRGEHALHERDGLVDFGCCLSGEKCRTFRIARALDSFAAQRVAVAVAAEREACAMTIVTMSLHASEHGCTPYESCIWCERVRGLDEAEERIRARTEKTHE